MKKKISISLGKDTYKRITAYAEKQNRSVSNMIEHVLKGHLDDIADIEDGKTQLGLVSMLMEGRDD